MKRVDSLKIDIATLEASENELSDSQKLKLQRMNREVQRLNNSVEGLSDLILQESGVDRIPFVSQQGANALANDLAQKLRVDSSQTQGPGQSKSPVTVSALRQEILNTEPVTSARATKMARDYLKLRSELKNTLRKKEGFILPGNNADEVETNIDALIAQYPNFTKADDLMTQLDKDIKAKLNEK